MVYDDELAARVRDAVGGMAPAQERRMFGGIAFMVNTHLACGLIGDDLMVRVGDEGYQPALQRGATEMAPFRSRGPMRGFVRVPAPLLADDAALESWVATGVTWAQRQPPKAPKPRRAPRSPRARG